ncbi:Hpt domain-containing protein [Oceanibacterium hippocampi]|uniref:Uncharacterized protein n=1 Tax=Oceanibacterium hippocampi TaxID=745714 RepID=A0A1Y5SIT8_9PROT|nr:Hpt domain-containing protein [Oceanibacterium hippocampi]SLN38788.1 hypothetical protein OCH7691_01612 [Oceanibacterium hippocampi]
MNKRRDPNAPPVKVRIYRFRNRLREKAGGLAGSGGGNGGAAEGGRIPAELIAKAQAEFEKLSEDYPDWVQKNLEDLHGIVEEAEADESRRAALFKRIQEVAHELKGQGGTFGYPLISRFGASLDAFTGPTAGRSDNHVKIVKAHVDAMIATIRARVSGDGGAIGDELTRTLDAAIAKYAKRT